MAGDIHVKEDSAFSHASRQMDSIVSQFGTDMGEAARNSASPAAEGAMQEGKDFMLKEREGRELLVTYLTKTKDGLSGYQNAAMEFDREHQGLVTLNTARLQTLIKPTEGAVMNDPAFNWGPIVQNQVAQPKGAI